LENDKRRLKELDFGCKKSLLTGSDLMNKKKTSSVDGKKTYNKIIILSGGVREMEKGFRFRLLE
jgi:hypothetical protein